MYMYQSKNVQKRENKGSLQEHFLDTCLKSDEFCCCRSVSPKTGAVTGTMTVEMLPTRRMLSAAIFPVTPKHGSVALTTNVSLGGASVTKQTTVEMAPMKTIQISVSKHLLKHVKKMSICNHKKKFVLLISLIYIEEQLYLHCHVIFC